jgi:hypothetical protein
MGRPSVFERRLTLSKLDRVMERLRNEFVQHGRPEHFEQLKVFRLLQFGSNRSSCFI